MSKLITVASMIHTAVRLAGETPESGGKVVLEGARDGEAGQEAITDGVDAEAFEAWCKANAGSPMLDRVRIVEDKPAAKAPKRPATDAAPAANQV